MSSPETLAWLAEFQTHFGQMLRSPLDRGSGTLRAQSEGYPSVLCALVSPGPRGTARERLAVYNRQYWFRLFGVLQHEYLLTARLVGMWMFNDLASRYLVAHPPAHHDAQRVAPGLLTFLSDALAQETDFGGVPVAALLEAATIDHIFSSVFLAPETNPFEPRALSGDLSKVQLRQAPSVALLAEHWPLLALRRRAQYERNTSKIPLPSALSAPQHWVVFRKGQGHAFARLHPLAHRLYTLLNEHSVAQALHLLESTCEDGERALLPRWVELWLREGARAGFWALAT